MNLLIKMKPNFAIRNRIDLGGNYIILANYESFNEVENVGFITKKNKGGFRSRIGRWQRKGTKEKELKLKSK